MGVATDKSLVGLTTAVNNISTSGMSDTTGQAINNTLGTLMTNTTGQAINTTLQSLVGSISPSADNVSFDNTGTGLSASNVQAMGEELASEKANINGDNIVNKATFRGNIGLQFDTFSFSGSADNWFNIETNCPLNSGYVPLGVIGSSLSRSGWTYNFTYNGNTSSTNWVVCITSPLATPSGTYSGSFLALKIT